MASDNPDPYSRHSLRQHINRIFKGPFVKKQDSDKLDPHTYEHLDPPTQDMIRGILELSDQIARDIMIPRVDVVSADCTSDIKTVVNTITEAGHSRVPVYENTIDNIIGILYSKDLLPFLLEKPKKFNLKKLLHEPFFVPETMPIDELLYEFKSRRLHLAIVVDEYGGVDGIVTLEDVLEEIVGEIEDEFDEDSKPEFEKISKNIYEVDSRFPISDFNEKLKLDLADDDVDTIGGLVFDLFGKIPAKNESVKFNNLTFKVLDIKGTVINRIRVSVTPPK